MRKTTAPKYSKAKSVVSKDPTQIKHSKSTPKGSKTQFERNHGQFITVSSNQKTVTIRVNPGKIRREQAIRKLNARFLK